MPVETLCPRCGYDLRGVVSTWRDACPLTGRCGECGLDVEWSELLSPSFNRPAWCFEFAPRARLPRTAIATFARIFRPRKFWSEVRMVHTLEERRLVIFAVLAALLAYLVFVGCHVLLVDEAWSRYFSRASVTTTDSRLGALLWSALLPWSEESLATGTNRWGTFAWSSSADFASSWRYIGWGGLGLLLMAAIGPAVLVGLRASRRLAGIRRDHLVRIGVYSLGWFALAWSIICVCHTITAFWGRPRWALDEMLGQWGEYAVLLGLPAWYFAWWWAASRRYLRIRHGAGVATAVTVIAVLSSMFLMTLVCEPMARYLFRMFGLLG